MSQVAHVRGSQVPRIFTPPLRELTPDTSWGFDIIWFANEILSQPLTPWQEWFVIHAFELLTPEQVRNIYPALPELWDSQVPRFKNIVLMVARQNGKTHVAKVILKWALFRRRMLYVLATAQTKGDAFELWEQVCDECEAHPRLSKRVNRVVRAHGFENLSITPPRAKRGEEPQKGGTFRIAGVDRKAGRGKTVNMLYADELREHKTSDGWAALSSLTLSPVGAFNLATSNAGDARSVVLRTLRNSALRDIQNENADTTIGFFEWSADPDRAIDDVEGWAQANPDLGHGRLTVRDIAAELVSKEDAEFRTENLCQWVETLDVGKIPTEWWAECADVDARPVDGAPVTVGVDVASNGTHAHIAIATRLDDGRVFVEVIASRAGYLWVPDVLAHLPRSWFSGKVGMQVRGSSAAHLAPLVTHAGLEVIEWQGSHMSSATLGMYNAVRDRSVCHLDQPLLTVAANGVKDRKAGDVFIWDRDKSTGDAAPFIACNIAWWMLTDADMQRQSAYDDPEFFGTDDVNIVTDSDEDHGLLIV